MAISPHLLAPGTESEVIGSTLYQSSLQFSGVTTVAASTATSLIEKANNEHRTSNIERPTSNTVFCQFKKNTEQSESTP